MNEFQQIAEELARRIGEITARYEAEMSMLRVENAGLKNNISELQESITELRRVDSEPST